MLYGAPNEYYEGAIRSHERHAEQYGYPMHVLRHDISQGYWNKPTYILSLVIQELSKAPEERSEWLWWFDADSIIINPQIPLEAFLPPSDQEEGYSNIHFIGNKDQSGLNTGTFFLRVHQWSVKLLAKTIMMPVFRPEVDLGFSVDQNAMAMLFNETEFREHVLWQPRIWCNTYEFSHGYEGKKGRLLVHFPGMNDERWKLMGEWLEVIEKHAEDWKVDLKESMYPEEIKPYWEALGKAKESLLKARGVGERVQRTPSPPPGENREGEGEKEGPGMITQAGHDDLMRAMERLKFVIETESDRVQAITEAQEELEKVVERVTSPPPPPPPPPPAAAEPPPPPPPPAAQPPPS
ncbi:MAG: stress-responsive transcription factor hsf1 [Watsoniomyces obsoletus]|nr:MAG: stress-responsive transcription factor hsf1 [Watsoniomyces obsoletus]